MGVNVYLRSKIEERTALTEVLENIQKGAADKQRDMTDAERQAYLDGVQRAKFLDEEIARITAGEQSSRQFMQVVGKQKEADEADARARAEREAAARDAAALERRTAMQKQQSWGQQFIESEQFKRYRGHGSMEPFELGGTDWLEQRAGQSLGSWGQGENIMYSTFPQPPVQSWGGPTQAQLRTPIFDIVGRVPTSLGSVEYYYWHPPTDDNMAGEVPEGELKPEAALEGELHAVPVATYAWWKGITRQALDDLPMIRAVVDNHLRQGVIRKINAEAESALITNTDIPEYDAGGDLLAAIRAGLAEVDTAGFSANAVILNPGDWASLDMMMLGATLGGASINNVFWGLRIVGAAGVPSGTAFVGDFNEGVTFFDRQQVAMMMTDSHTDYFLRNKMVLLAEARGKVVVTNAAAIVKCTGDVEEELGRSGKAKSQVRQAAPAPAAAQQAPPAPRGGRSS